MRSRIDFIESRIAGNLESSGTPITLVWNVWAPNAVRDTVTHLYPGTPTVTRETTGAFLHFVSATTQVRQFNEVQIGDAIADISPKINLAGRDGLTFLLPTGPCGDWQTWTNKPVSSQLAVFWDTLMAGRQLYQTVLLRRAA
jgi:hypothetical protein